VPSISKEGLVDKSLDFWIIIHAFLDFLCSLVELSHKLEEQINDEDDDSQGKRWPCISQEIVVMRVGIERSRRYCSF